MREDTECSSQPVTTLASEEELSAVALLASLLTLTSSLDDMVFQAYQCHHHNHTLIILHQSCKDLIILT